MTPKPRDRDGESRGALLGDALRVIGPWVAIGGGLAALRTLKGGEFSYFYVTLIPVGLAMWLVGRVWMARGRRDEPPGHEK